MVWLNSSPTPCFWNCVGVGLTILSVGVSINISRTKTLEIELAQYKLKTGSAISKVREVTSDLEEVTQSTSIEDPRLKAIEQELSESNLILEQAEAEIERETDKLIHSTSEQ